MTATISPRLSPRRAIAPIRLLVLATTAIALLLGAIIVDTPPVGAIGAQEAWEAEGLSIAPPACDSVLADTNSDGFPDLCVQVEIVCVVSQYFPIDYDGDGIADGGFTACVPECSNNEQPRLLANGVYDCSLNCGAGYIEIDTDFDFVADACEPGGIACPALAGIIPLDTDLDGVIETCGYCMPPGGWTNGRVEVIDRNHDGVANECEAVDDCLGLPVTIWGTNSSDTIYATPLPDVIHGLGGDDVIVGLGGDDVICGGSGRDTILGGSGVDQILGGDHVDRILGQDGNDVIYGGGGSDRLWGGDGIDVIEGGAGADNIRGGAGDDELHGGGGRDTIFGGDGDDLIRGNHSSDRLVGNDGNDDIAGHAGRDLIDGGSGDDWLRGGVNSDTLLGGTGADRLEGQQGRDTLVGGPGVDYLNGGPHSDSCTDTSASIFISC